MNSKIELLNGLNLGTTELRPCVTEPWMGAGETTEVSSDLFDAYAFYTTEAESLTVCSAHLFVAGKAYRWIQPAFLTDYNNYFFDLDKDPRFTAEGLKYIDCEIWDDFVSKIHKAFSTGEHDNYVLMDLKLDEDLLEHFSKKGENLEEVVAIALQSAIESEQALNNATWRRLQVAAYNEHRVFLTVDNITQNISPYMYRLLLGWLATFKEQQAHLVYSDKLTREGLKIKFTDSLSNRSIEAFANILWAKED